MYLSYSDIPPRVHAVLFRTVDSTNTYAREYVKEGGRAPAMFVAEQQSCGRGRQGKSFYSRGAGVYMSLLIDTTDQPMSSTVSLTGAAAVAVARACDAVSGKRCFIKWVNDIYVDGKKAAGILAESFSADERRYAVIGVGVNLGQPDFPEELRDIATVLSSDASDGTRRALALCILQELLEIIDKLGAGDTSYMDEYRARSMVLGREIIFVRNGITCSGTARSIDENGALCVELERGELQHLGSGEISLRLRR